MALNVLTAPDDFGFVKNPIHIDLLTDDRLATSGVKWARAITFSSGAVSGTFDVSFNGIDVVMTAEAAPITEDGAHFRTQGASTLDQWITNFVEDLGFNYYIKKNYTLLKVGSAVYFTAVEYGPEWEIIFNAIPGSYSLGSATAGVSQAEQSNFRVMVEVHTNVADPITIEAFKVADSYTGGYDGHFRARLDGVLRGLCSVPAPDGDLIQPIVLNDKQLVAYYLRYYEIYGTTPTAKNYYLNDNDDDYYYAQVGGLKKHLWPNSTFWNDYQAEIKFLTWQPRTQQITENQAVWLYFLCHHDGVSISVGFVRTVIYYTDGSNSGHNILDWDIDNTPKKCLYFPAGYYQVIEAIKTSGKIVSHWTMELRDNETGTTVSEQMRFDLVANKPRHTRVAVFENSLGGFDSIRVTGESVTGLDVTGEVLSRWLDVDYTAEFGEVVSGEPYAIPRTTFNTGLLNKKSMLDLLQELLTTRQIYLAERVGSTTVTELTPLAMIRSSVSIKRDYLEADGFYLTFEAVDGFEFNGHSEIVE